MGEERVQIHAGVVEALGGVLEVKRRELRGGERRRRDHLLGGDRLHRVAQRLRRRPPRPVVQRARQRVRQIGLRRRLRLRRRRVGVGGVFVGFGGVGGGLGDGGGGGELPYPLHIMVGDEAELGLRGGGRRHLRAHQVDAHELLEVMDVQRDVVLLPLPRRRRRPRRRHRRPPRGSSAPTAASAAPNRRRPSRRPRRSRRRPRRGPTATSPSTRRRRRRRRRALPRSPSTNRSPPSAGPRRRRAGSPSSRATRRASPGARPSGARRAQRLDRAHQRVELLLLVLRVGPEHRPHPRLYLGAKSFILYISPAIPPLPPRRHMNTTFCSQRLSCADSGSDANARSSSLTPAAHSFPSDKIAKTASYSFTCSGTTFALCSASAIASSSPSAADARLAEERAAARRDELLAGARIAGRRRRRGAARRRGWRTSSTSRGGPPPVRAAARAASSSCWPGLSSFSIASPCVHSAKAYHFHSSLSGLDPAGAFTSGVSAASHDSTTPRSSPSTSDCRAARHQSSGSGRAAPSEPLSSSFAFASAAARARPSIRSAARSSRCRWGARLALGAHHGLLGAARRLHARPHRRHPAS